MGIHHITTELAKQIKEIKKVLKTHGKNERFNQTTISIMKGLLYVDENAQLDKSMLKQ
jgi:hypothetical protein